MKQKVECDTRRTTHVHCEQTRKSEEIYSPLFLLPRQRRGKINVLNNKILRTFETRGDFFFVSFFPFFSFFYCHTSCFLISSPKLFSEFVYSKPVKENRATAPEIAKESNINFYCFQLLFAAIIAKNIFLHFKSRIVKYFIAEKGIKLFKLNLSHQ